MLLTLASARRTYFAAFDSPCHTLRRPTDSRPVAKLQMSCVVAVLSSGGAAGVAVLALADNYAPPSFV